MLGQKRIPALLFLLGTLLTQVGCVALNIPSQRFHDPSDKGGLFGHWKGGHEHTVPCTAADEFHDSSGGIFIDGGALEVDPLDPLDPVSKAPKQPEVPWPRFHPVPTRPIFGSSNL